MTRTARAWKPMAAGAVIHPLAVRVTHWINAVATIVMIGSGLQIHNAHPTLPFQVPGLFTIGGWLGGALQWHFAAMWLFLTNGMAMLVYGIASGRYFRKLLPISPAAVLRDAGNSLRGRLSHENLSTYNAVQRLLYAGVILAGVLAAISGLAIWKPVQFQALTMALGDFDQARFIHFVTMAVIAAFLVIHVAMALIVPKSFIAMLRGR